MTNTKTSTQNNKSVNFLVLLLITGFSSMAQDYLGTWAFEKVINLNVQEVIVEDDRNTINDVFKSYYLELHRDSTYTATMLSVTNGGAIEFKSDTILLGKSDRFKLTDSQTAVLSTIKFDLQFKKQDGSIEGRSYKFLAADDYQKIKYSKDLIIGRWVAKEAKAFDNEDDPVLTETLLSSLTLTLLQDGLMDFNIFGVQQSKLWGIDETRTQLILGADEVAPEIYNVCKLNDKELIIQSNSTGTLIYLVKETEL